jgi:prolyl-tRNA synthetase
MYDTYTKIFTRCGLKFQPVLADTGNIGGNGSHQFMALSDVGESDIAYCDNCNYAADVEKATSKLDDYKGLAEGDLEKVYTPNSGTIEELVKFFNVDAKNFAKTLIYHDFMNEKFIIAVIRGDREINLIKLVNESNSNENYLKMATDEELLELGFVKGFCGPQGKEKYDIYVDEEIANMTSLITGANELNYHVKNVKFGRDFNGKVCDLRTTVANDLCPVCGKPLKINRGIEVGQIFKLQTKYSEPMKCTYVDEKGANVPMVMGCYGIGVTRTLQSIVEQYHDEFGIKWPINVAPYHAVIVPVKYDDPSQKELADKMHSELESLGIEVILDDRDERPGFKFKDWELIGIPFIVTVGRRAQEGIVEFKDRQTMEKVELSLDEAIQKIVFAVKNSK